jgi:predicted nucleotidyltransferase
MILFGSIVLGDTSAESDIHLLTNSPVRGLEAEARDEHAVTQ